jgi:serine/threonine-protein kinase
VILEQTAPDWRSNLFVFGPDPQDIAILPFEIRGLDGQGETAWKGLFKELSSTLTRMQQFDDTLRVVPAREIDTLSVTSPSQARRFFLVNLVIDGVVEWTGRDLRVTINLSDAVELRQLDSELIVDPDNDLIRVKERVLQGLVRLLQINLEPDTFKVLAATGTTVSGAYDHYVRGLEYLESSYTPGNLERAISELRLATQEDTSFAAPHAALARALTRDFFETHEVERLEEARKRCEEAVGLDDRLPESHIACAFIDATEGNYEEAAEGYRKAIDLDPGNSEARRRLAFALGKMGEFEKAETVWTEAIDLRPDYWLGYYELGTFRVRQGDFEGAIEPLRRALGYVPENYQIHGNLGTAFYQLGRLDEAAQYYLLSAQIQPNYVAFANLGSIYLSQEEYKKAAEKYEAALELHASDYAVWGNLALACDNIAGRSADVEKFYEQAIELGERRLQVNPKNLEVAIHLADYNVELGRNERARQLLEEALELHSENPDLMARLGVLFEKLGDREQSIVWTLEALQAGYPRERFEALSSLAELRNDPEFQRRFEELEGAVVPENVN